MASPSSNDIDSFYRRLSQSFHVTQEPVYKSIEIPKRREDNAMKCEFRMITFSQNNSNISQAAKFKNLQDAC